ncbi:MAG: ABC transporter substrate-binding protein [Myxococcales bacterium]|nr:MAG: ABC transporter substrate-binding protein [Myxococcales bacterium]
MRSPPLLAAALALTASGCLRPTPRSDALEVVVATPPATLDPRLSTDPVAMRVTRLLHAGLVRLDERTLEPVPYAAARWGWVDDRTLDLELRPGLRFASGAPLEPEDVCATIEALGSPALGSPHRTLVASIARCERRGTLGLRLVLGEARATLLTDMELPILRRDQAGSPPGTALDGLGPFVLGAVSESAVELRARDGGALPRPARDVVVRVVRDETARATRLLAGQADVVPNAVSPPMLAALAAQGARVDSQPGANLTYLLVHNERPGLDTPAARWALGQAIDRDLLAATLLGGHARVARSFLPPESWAAPDAVPPLPTFAPAAARAALGSLGPVQLLCSTDRQRVTMARAVAQMLGDVGVPVELMPLDLGVLLHRLSSGDYELAILQIPEFTEPNLLRWFFHSASIPAPGRGGANRARHASPALDAVLDEASRNPDREARRALYARALGLLAADLPVVPLFHENQVAVLSPRAAGFHLSAEGRWLSLASP